MNFGGRLINLLGTKCIKFISDSSRFDISIARCLLVFTFLLDMGVYVLLSVCVGGTIKLSSVINSQWLWKWNLKTLRPINSYSV